jgi:molecular chaperone DnaK
MTRGDFERITADLMQRTRDTTELVLTQAKVSPGQLDEVVLVGGSTYMPLVEMMLKEVCGRQPSRELSPEEAVAQGAAIHAAILEARATGGESRMAKMVINRLRNVSATDVNSHSLGVEITDPNNRSRKMNYIMIPRNTPIPFKVAQRFSTTVQNQQRVHVRLLQGETEDIDACTLIGDFRISKMPSNLPAGSPVELSYQYDANGRIHASAKELTGNNQATAEIVRDGGLSEGNVDDAFESLTKQYTVE